MRNIHNQHKIKKIKSRFLRQQEKQHKIPTPQPETQEPAESETVVERNSNEEPPYSNAVLTPRITKLVFQNVATPANFTAAGKDLMHVHQIPHTNEQSPKQERKPVWEIQENFIKTRKKIDKRFKLSRSAKQPLIEGLKDNQLSRNLKIKLLKDLKQHKINNSGNISQKIEIEKSQLKIRRKTPDVVETLMRKSQSQPTIKMENPTGLSRLAYYNKMHAIKAQQTLR